MAVDVPKSRLRTFDLSRRADQIQYATDLPYAEQSTGCLIVGLSRSTMTSQFSSLLIICLALSHGCSAKIGRSRFPRGLRYVPIQFTFGIIAITSSRGEFNRGVNSPPPRSQKPVTLYIDADARPVKQEVYRVAERHASKGHRDGRLPSRRHGRTCSTAVRSKFGIDLGSTGVDL